MRIEIHHWRMTIEREEHEMSCLAAPVLVVFFVLCMPSLCQEKNPAGIPSSKHSNPDQNRTEDENVPRYSSARPLNCEDFAALLDMTLIEWREVNDTRLIIISRLGSGETSSKLAWARLHYFTEYIEQKQVRYVLAQGTPVAGFGRIEFYVKGKLLTSIPVRRSGRTVCVGGLGA
jgi:hypothetical protein